MTGRLQHGQMHWHAIYVKPHCEDSAAMQLRRADIEVLAPKILITKYLLGKYLRVTEPLFPAYLFARFAPAVHGHMITYTRGVRYIVGRECPLKVPAEIIQTIQARMEGDLVMPVPEKLQRGERVRIKEGPFTNFYGVFERDIPGRERSMILLDALHCTLEIESISLQKA